jgi:multiple sugar transport system permease protein
MQGKILRKGKAGTMTRKARLRKASRLSGDIASYFFLICFGFVFLFPIIYMLGYSFMSVEDIRSALVTYVPTHLDLSNYQTAARVLDFWPSLFSSIYVAALPAACQTIASSLTAYGLSRFRFPGRSLIFILVVATVVIPPTTTMLPQFLMYNSLGLTGSVFAFILPALFGQGLRSGLMILVFYMIFNTIPKTLYEAALIDGAGAVRLFLRIGLPLVKSGIVIAFLFSFIWYWGDTTLTTIYMGNEISTLPMQLERFMQTFTRIYANNAGKSLNEAVYMAGTLLSILPLLIFYFVIQKQFVQSVDKTGITGE